LVNELVPRLLAERSIEDPLARAMAREWVVTPSTGTKQWLTRELSRQIGATPGGTDGIVANWLHEFPSRLSGRILDAHLLETTGLESDPWALPQLQFTLLKNIPITQRSRH
jgi:exonuclease V gamma subunit